MGIKMFRCCQGKMSLFVLPTIAANKMENVKKAVEHIRNILKQGIETPEDQNDHGKCSFENSFA